MASSIFDNQKLLKRYTTKSVKNSPHEHQCEAIAEHLGSDWKKAKVEWDGHRGWHLENHQKKMPTAQGIWFCNLKTCPFCKLVLPVVNKVEIS